MKIHTLTLAALLFLSTQVSHARTLIVSDVDDTIKMTGVLKSHSIIVWNGVVRTKAFAGMSELYKELAKKDNDFYYVSGSPKIIRTRVDEFLEDNKFPQRYNLALKGWISEDTVAYKTDTIKSLVKELRPDKLILIGDDTEHDPEIYDGIARDLPGLVESIYIRSVSNRELPENSLIKSYFSAVEIAGHELVKGNLDVQGIRKVTKGFLWQTNDSGIALSDSYCPRVGRSQIEDLKAALSGHGLDDVFERTQDKIKRSCN